MQYQACYRPSGFLLLRKHALKSSYVEKVHANFWCFDRSLCSLQLVAGKQRTASWKSDTLQKNERHHLVLKMWLKYRDAGCSCRSKGAVAGCSIPCRNKVIGLCHTTSSAGPLARCSAVPQRPAVFISRWWWLGIHTAASAAMARWEWRGRTKGWGVRLLAQVAQKV